MAQYLLRKGTNFYEIAKFEDSDDSIAVYKFTQRGCSCPAGRRGCKHIAILKAWQATGEVPGIVYDDSSKQIAVLNVA